MGDTRSADGTTAAKKYGRFWHLPEELISAAEVRSLGECVAKVGAVDH
jgi:hypothetical protein